MPLSTRPSTSCASSAAASPSALDAAARTVIAWPVDFEGKIDGEPFEGGKAEGFQFLVGEGQMLKEFEDAVRGMKAGESKTFPLAFPADYHGKEVAGKTADFLVTVKKIEAAHLPEVNDALAKSLALLTVPSKACAQTSRRTSSVKSSSACWLATSKP